MPTQLQCPECGAVGEVVSGGPREEIFSFRTQFPLEEMCPHRQPPHYHCPSLAQAMTEAIERATRGH